MTNQIIVKKLEVVTGKVSNLIAEELYNNEAFAKGFVEFFANLLVSSVILATPEDAEELEGFVNEIYEASDEELKDFVQEGLVARLSGEGGAALVHKILGSDMIEIGEEVVDGETHRVVKASVPFVATEDQ